MKLFNIDNFHQDLKFIPLQICVIFDDPNDMFCSYNQMLNEVVNQHACTFKRKYVKKRIPVLMNKELQKAIYKKHCPRNQLN